LGDEEFTKKAEADAAEIERQLETLTRRYEDSLSKIVHCKLLKGGEAHIQRRELKTHIEVFVKVFHGDRKTFSFRVSILDKIQVLFTLLAKEDAEEMGQYYQTRLIYPMGYLRNLSECAQDTFLEQRIPD
jgi:hypothetical protein